MYYLFDYDVIINSYVPFNFPGHPSNTPIHENIKLVVWQYLLPHDDWQPRAGLQVAVRNLLGLQDGRPSDVIHLPHAYEHEQAAVCSRQVTPTDRLRHRSQTFRINCSFKVCLLLIGHQSQNDCYF